MIKNDLQKTDELVMLKHKCPICGKIKHNLKKVFTENNAQLLKIENTYISWCEEVNEHILIKKNQLLF